MRRLKKLLPFLCTILLLGLGASLPRLTSLSLDRRLERETASFEDTAVSLSMAQNSDLFQSLPLLQGETLSIALDKGVHMTADEAAAAGTALLQALSADGAAGGELQVTPCLIADKNDPGRSGVFWECLWWETSPDGSDIHTILWLDDASGLLMAFQSQLGPLYGAASSSTIRLFLTPDYAEKMAKFCQSHYPVDAVELEARSQNEISGDYSLTLCQEQDGKTVCCTLPLALRGSWLFFNLTP